VAYLKSRFASEFKAAFQEAMASLSERNQEPAAAASTSTG